MALSSEVSVLARAAAADKRRVNAPASLQREDAPGQSGHMSFAAKVCALALPLRRPHLSGRQEEPMARTYDYDFATGTLRDGATNPRSRREIVERLDRLATLLDSALVIPGTNIRFGADAVLGLVPGIGDLVTTAMSAYIVYEAHRLGAPHHLIMRMVGNVAFDSVITAVPVAGNVADVFFRANRRNMRLLREWIERENLA